MKPSRGERRCLHPRREASTATWADMVSGRTGAVCALFNCFHFHNEAQVSFRQHRASRHRVERQPRFERTRLQRGMQAVMLNSMKGAQKKLPHLSLSQWDGVALHLWDQRLKRGHAGGTPKQDAPPGDHGR